MDITEFKRILTAFADEPTDVDIRLGKVVAQIRDDLIDATIAYSPSDAGSLLVTEGEQQYPARSWLINRVARLPQLADRILAATTETPEAALRSPFVEPSGILSPDLSDASTSNDDLAVDDVVNVLLAKASSPLPGATSLLYVTSDAGEGKTTVINRAARLQAERFKAKASHSLIVPVPLTGKAFLNFDDAVIAALVNRLRFGYLYFNAFVELVRLGVVVPAFDGYEEMLVEGSKGEAISALGNLLQTLDSSGTIFIAARKAFFEYVSFKTQARLLDAIGDRSASFSRLAISRWTRDQFCQYGRLRHADAPEEVFDIVAARLGADHPLLTRAVLVKRLFDVAANTNSRDELVDMLGNNPHDYFFVFVDAIVKREAMEKWLARVSGDVMEPLLDTSQHHQLLSLIAQEMWQSATNSLRYDIVDVLVDLFAESQKRNAVVVRQIKERLKQHSLLASDASRSQALRFDHDDFQNFYLGEALGHLLKRLARVELHAFLSVNIVPTATIEQAVQCLVRNEAPLEPVLALLLAINESETGFSFCKENCGALAIRLAECIQEHDQPLALANMYFATGSLSGRSLRKVHFESCHFQPTGALSSAVECVVFRGCEFERLELSADKSLANQTFDNCKIDSLLLIPDEEPTFDPAQIVVRLSEFGASIGDGLENLDAGEMVMQEDDRLRQLERFLRIFLRSTSIGDSIIRLRLGKGGLGFFDHVLPALLEKGVLEEVPWMGKGVQHRYKLARPMSDIARAIEQAHGDFDAFLTALDS